MRDWLVMDLESLTKEPMPWDESPCPYCGGRVINVSNAVIYNGHTFGNGRCYLCVNCRASCGVHGNPATRRPLGVLATPEMKFFKQSCHKKFDSVWRNNKLSRNQCYKQLAKLMGICPKCCHFGWFNQPDLELANAILSDESWYKR
ncbi:zinc-finger-containing protein [Lactiplantibacillus plantarum]|uniref:zinc-finger-containing protein n=1 Tax=Lactiplantibacillus plantarum TaxID=1590 RepID=UPI003F52C545